MGERNKRVLFVSGLKIYPPTSGGTLRSSQLIKSLVKQGHSVSIYSFVGRSQDYSYRSGFKNSAKTFSVDADTVETVSTNILFAFIQKFFYLVNLPPLWILLLLKVSRPKALKDLQDNSDIVIFDFPFVWSKYFSHMHSVFNTHNVESNLVKTGNFFSRALAKYVRSIEINAANNSTEMITCSQADKAWFINNSTAKTIHVIPNGIDCDRFNHSEDNRIKVRESLGYDSDDIVILFPASSYGPNLAGLKFIEDFCCNNEGYLQKNQIRFLVAGSVSGHKYEKANLKVLSKVDAIEPYFGAADAGINPVFSGSGTNVKMGEFICARLPVFTTEFGCRGFVFNHKIHGFIFSVKTLLTCIEDFILSRRSESIFVKKLTDKAYLDNADVIDMTLPVSRLVSGW